MLGRTALVLSVALLTGCPGTTEPPSDASTDGLADGAPDRGDDDGDGLCNQTELDRGTDPLDPDTDADGYSDFVEVFNNYDPLVPAVPTDDVVFRLLEMPGSMVRASHTLVIRGSGQDYAGAFESRDARDADGLTAADFWDGSVALFANPPENVAVVEADAERFRGVVGTTELNFETTFTYDASVGFESCLRAYPFRYQVKRSDGTVLAFERYLLVVVPPINTGEWCTPALPCF